MSIYMRTSVTSEIGSMGVDKEDIAPEKLDSKSDNLFSGIEYAKGKQIVGWEGPDDPEAPRNWSFLKKTWITLLISLCTTSIYMGAAIFTPAESDLIKEFHTSRVKVALGLTLFVYGFGIGSLWFSPMSEIPLFRGRNPTYFLCQLVFCCLQIPTALVNHIAPFAVLRFLAGIFASPPLATAGATLSDIWAFPALTYALVAWESGTVAGPFLGPLVGGALVQGHGRRYPFWFLLATSGGILILMVLFLPETSEQELLMRKARKLRRQTGTSNFVAPGDIVKHTTSTRAVVKSMFWKPIELTIMEPVVLLINLHLGLAYSIMYLFFEAFPLVYGDLYGFNLVQQGIAYIPLLIGEAIGGVLYVYIQIESVKRTDRPEWIFGPSAVIGSIFLPLGIIAFGWASARGVYWVYSMIGLLFFGIGLLFLFESYLAFIGTMFPPNAAGSAFASNSIVKSLMGGSFPLFGTVMYKHLSTYTFPVGWGCTIVGLAAALLIPFPVYLTLRGGYLREYAQKKYGNKLYR